MSRTRSDCRIVFRAPGIALPSSHHAKITKIDPGKYGKIRFPAILTRSTTCPNSIPDVQYKAYTQLLERDRRDAHCVLGETQLCNPQHTSFPQDLYSCPEDFDGEKLRSRTCRDANPYPRSLFAFYQRSTEHLASDPFRSPVFPSGHQMITTSCL